MAIVIQHSIFIKCFSLNMFQKDLKKSKYKNNIILKGGVLLSSIIGEDLRTTKDIDASLKSLPLNIDSIRSIFNEILSIDIKDNVSLKLNQLKT